MRSLEAREVQIVSAGYYDLESVLIGSAVVGVVGLLVYGVVSNPRFALAVAANLLVDDYYNDYYYYDTYYYY